MHFLRSFVADEKNLFGVCAALGHDFGFNPLYLRLAFAMLLLTNPPVVMGTYVVLGVVVFVAHTLFPGSQRSRTRREAEPA